MEVLLFGVILYRVGSLKPDYQEHREMTGGPGHGNLQPSNLRDTCVETKSTVFLNNLLVLDRSKLQRIPVLQNAEEVKVYQMRFCEFKILRMSLLIRDHDLDR